MCMRKLNKNVYLRLYGITRQSVVSGSGSGLVFKVENGQLYIYSRPRVDSNAMGTQSTAPAV